MYFCSGYYDMTATETILNYAVLKGGTFLRKDLLRDIDVTMTDVTRRSVDLQLGRMVSSGVLERNGRGEYRLASCSLPEFVYVPSEDEQSIFLNLKQQFPFLDFCIWSPRVLSPFMLHVPNIGYSFVDVEKDGMESVFHALQGMSLGRNVLLDPSPRDCDLYLTGSDAIVVRQLTSQSPLTMVNGCVVPRIEKILVDAVGDDELLFAGGSEIYNIYEYARERNNVNMSKLLRYASRRGRKEQVEKIISTIDNDRQEKQVH